MIVTDRGQYVTDRGRCDVRERAHAHGVVGAAGGGGGGRGGGLHCADDPVGKNEVNYL